MAYGYSNPAAVFSTGAFVCAVAAMIGLSPLLAPVAILAAAVASGRGESPARVAVLVSVAALFAAFFLPSAQWWSGW